jgi:hypothetical protein
VTPKLQRHADRWIFEEFRASAYDLAVARIVLAGYLLLAVIPQARWISNLPQAFYNPPLSLAALSGDFPSEPVVAALNIAAFASALSLLPHCSSATGPASPR